MYVVVFFYETFFEAIFTPKVIYLHLNVHFSCKAVQQFILIFELQNWESLRCSKENSIKVTEVYRIIINLEDISKFIRRTLKNLNLTETSCFRREGH